VNDCQGHEADVQAAAGAAAAVATVAVRAVKWRSARTSRCTCARARAQRWRAFHACTRGITSVQQSQPTLGRDARISGWWRAASCVTCRGAVVDVENTTRRACGCNNNRCCFCNSRRHHRRGTDTGCIADVGGSTGVIGCGSQVVLRCQWEGISRGSAACCRLVATMHHHDL